MQDKLAERGIKNIICTTAVPGLAASNLQATTSDHGGGWGLQLFMKFAQSAEDGTLPLLMCTTAPEIESGDLVTPGNSGPLSWMLGDSLSGWPKKRPVENLCSSEEGKQILWEQSELAVGPFFAT